MKKDMRTLCVTSRSCSILLDPEGLYEAREKRTLALNGEPWGEEYRSITSLFDLEPDTEYVLESRTDGGETETLSFRTKKELCCLDVRDFGAKGDGVSEDTAMLQAAILSCPENGRVFIPPGEYLTGPLFLKSHCGRCGAAAADGPEPLPDPAGDRSGGKPGRGAPDGPVGRQQRGRIRFGADSR